LAVFKTEVLFIRTGNVKELRTVVMNAFIAPVSGASWLPVTPRQFQKLL
jgi:hypothetical protein